MSQLQGVSLGGLADIREVGFEEFNRLQADPEIVADQMNQIESMREFAGPGRTVQITG